MHQVGLRLGTNINSERSSVLGRSTSNIKRRERLHVGRADADVVHTAVDGMTFGPYIGALAGHADGIIVGKIQGAVTSSALRSTLDQILAGDLPSL